MRGDGRSHALSEPQRRNDAWLRIYSNERISRLRHRGCVSLVRRVVNLLTNALVDRAQFGFSYAFASQHTHIPIYRIILLLPTLNFTGRHVRLIVVFGVPLATISNQFDQRWPTTLTRTIH